MTRPGEAHLFERAIDWMTANDGTGAPATPVPVDGVALAPVTDAAPADIASPAAAAPASARLAAAASVNRRRVDLALLEAAGLVVAGAQRSRLAEEWRITASNLLRALRTAGADAQSRGPGNILMVTSTRPGEGKTFSSINLAGRLSRDSMTDVLLLDADSKPGGLSDMLDLSDCPGLFDLAADPALPAEDLIVPTAIDGFSFLPVGRRPADAVDAAGRTITRPAVAAIEALARRFPGSVLVLDTPPCLAASDASTLAAAATQIAFVVEAEGTQRHELEAALDLLRPCPNITLILNKLRQVSTAGFGQYQYHYG